MIDGLKLTMKGSELKGRVAERIRDHRDTIQRYRKARDRKPDEQTDAEPCLPEQLCDYEIACCEYSIEKLTLILDHLNEAESYLLGRRDLKFADLLPDPPL
jgi:hypothetical protein